MELRARRQKVSAIRYMLRRWAAGDQMASDRRVIQAIVKETEGCKNAADIASSAIKAPLAPLTLRPARRTLSGKRSSA